MAPTLQDISNALYRRGISHICVASPHDVGAFVATPGCARVLAFGKSMSSPTLFWVDPSVLSADGLQELSGPCGGERLWFGPEARYHWDGPPDWTGFSNNNPSQQVDPGAYKLSIVNGLSAQFRGVIRVIDHATGAIIRASVEKTVSLIHPSEKAGAYGLRITTSLRADPKPTAFPIDIWALIQFAPGTQLSVLLAENAVSNPQAYTPSRGSWTASNEAVRWKIKGSEVAKIGLGSRQITGVTRVRVPEPETNLDIVYAHERDAIYCDHPYNVPRTDQVLQIWDGLGFGELELHSPMAQTRSGEEETRLIYKIVVSSGNGVCLKGRDGLQALTKYIT